MQVINNFMLQHILTVCTGWFTT